MSEKPRVIPAITIPPGMSREQANALAAIAVEAHRQMQSPSVKRAIAQADAAKAPESPANNALREAVRQELPETQATVRVIWDKQAPIDEGYWEFRLSGGMLEVIAWNDSKTEAHCVRFVRRGVEIHQMVQREQGDE